MTKEGKKIEALLDALMDDDNGRVGIDIDTKSDKEEWKEQLRFLQLVDEATNKKYGEPVDVDGAWESFATQHDLKGRRSVHWLHIIMAAAAVAAIVVATFSLWPKTNADDSTVTAHLTVQPTRHATTASETTQRHKMPVAEKARLLTVKTGRREIKTVVLDDGSEVTLNAQSELTYPDRFTGQKRMVSLKGEAYFKVARDESRPFILRSGSITTKVLGTEFNMRGYDMEEAHVTLVSGKVEVMAYNNRVTISPNQDACLVGETLEVNEVNVKAFTSWRNGIMYFDDDTLENILQQIGNWYGANIVCRDRTLLDKRYHYMFNTTDSLEEVLDLIRQSSEVVVSLKGNTIYVE